MTTLSLLIVHYLRRIKITTLTFCGQYFAADSRQTNGSIIESDEEYKIIKLKGGKYREDKLLYCALAGKVSDFNQVIDSLNNTFKPLPKDLEVSALVIGLNNVYELEFQQTDIIKCSNNKVAIGSGKCFALAYLMDGYTAIEAVEKAIKLDCYSGGPVRWIDVQKAREAYLCEQK